MSKDRHPPVRLQWVVRGWRGVAGAAVPTVTRRGRCPSWVFLHEKAYQERDTAIESSVVTKVKGVAHYAGRVLDTADYVTPPQVRGRRAPPCLSFPAGAAGGCWW